MGRKIKVSLTLDERVVEAVDRAAGEGPRPNRSEVVERALRTWLRSERHRRLDEEIEAYYADLSAAEQAEDAAWAGLGDEGASRWDEP